MVCVSESASRFLLWFPFIVDCKLVDLSSVPRTHARRSQIHAYELSVKGINRWVTTGPAWHAWGVPGKWTNPEDWHLRLSSCLYTCMDICVQTPAHTNIHTLHYTGILPYLNPSLPQLYNQGWNVVKTMLSFFLSLLSHTFHKGQIPKPTQMCNSENKPTDCIPGRGGGYTGLQGPVNWKAGLDSCSFCLSRVCLSFVFLSFSISVCVGYLCLFTLHIVHRH